MSLKSDSTSEASKRFRTWRHLPADLDLDPKIHCESNPLERDRASANRFYSSLRNINKFEEVLRVRI